MGKAQEPEKNEKERGLVTDVCKYVISGLVKKLANRYDKIHQIHNYKQNDEKMKVFNKMNKIIEQKTETKIPKLILPKFITLKV